jgi:N utilization substance protein B
MIDPHRARRLALQGLCSLDVQGPAALELVGRFIDDSEDTVEVRQWATELLREAWDNREESDKLLTRHAKHWHMDRLALVDRNILRLAVSEMLGLKLSHKIVITEALQLAHEFSTAESPRFINGVLDAVAREIATETA